MKTTLVLLISLTSFTSLASSKFCDDVAKKAGLQAHINEYSICEETGCTAYDVIYLGRKGSVKSYKVYVSDEVDGDTWLVKADSSKDCKIIFVKGLGYEG